MEEIIKGYIEMRNNRHVDPIWFIRYALEKTGKRFQYKDIYTYLQFSNHEDIFNHLDKELGLDILVNRGGGFIKCYSSK